MTTRPLIQLFECATPFALNLPLRTLEGSAAVLLRGLPTSDEETTKRIFSEISTALGSPCAYPNSRYGSGVVHLLKDPPPPLVDKGLDWHTEDAFAKVVPSIIALLCLQGDAQVRTHLCRLKGPLIDEGVEGWVEPDPYLYARAPAELRPLAFTGSRDTGWRYDPALIKPKKAGESHPALEQNASQHCVLRKGDLLVFNNHVLAHARDSTNPTGRRRLLRMIIR